MTWISGNLRGVLGICDTGSGRGNTGWSWADGVDTGDHSWDAGGDVAGGQGHWGGNWVDWGSWGGDWVHWDVWCGGTGRAVGVHYWSGTDNRVGGGPGRAVGDLRCAGGDSVDDSGALIFC